MFKSKKGKLEPTSKEPVIVPKAFKERYNSEEEQEEIVEAVNGEEESEEQTEMEEEISSIQRNIDKLKSMPLQRQTKVIDNNWEIARVPARTVIRNKETGEELESWEDILRILNGESN